MNENYEQLIARFLENDELSPSELESLRDKLLSDPQLASQLNDDRAIHAILQSSSPNSESFVDACVEQFRRLDLDTSSNDLSELNVNSRRRLPIGNDLATYHNRIANLDENDDANQHSASDLNPISNNGHASNGGAPKIASITPEPRQRHTTLAESDSELFEASHDPSQSATDVDTASVRNALVKNKSGFRRKLLVVTSLAASLLAIIVGAIWFNGQTDSPIRPTAGVTEPKQSSNDHFESPEKQEMVAQDEANDSMQPEPFSPSLKQENEGGFEELAEGNIKTDAPSASDVDPVAGFATVYSGKAIWKRLPWPGGTEKVEEGVSVNAVMLELESGIASVKFNNGARLDLLGMSDARIVQENSIVLGKGTFMLSIPSSQNDFAVSTKTAALYGAGNMNAQITISEQGVIESYLFDGNLSLLRKGEPSDKAIRLTKGVLEHVVMSPLLGNDSLPSISMARGAGGGLFMGQLGMERNFLKVDSPPIFAQMLSQLVPKATTTSDEDEPELIDVFEKAFENFGAVKDDDGNPVPPSTGSQASAADGFSGSISLNGKTEKFDSPQEYFSAIKQHFQRLNRPFELNQNTVSDLDELGFEIDGMTIRFSELDKMKERRELMSDND